MLGGGGNTVGAFVLKAAAVSKHDFFPPKQNENRCNECFRTKNVLACVGFLFGKSISHQKGLGSGGGHTDGRGCVARGHCSTSASRASASPLAAAPPPSPSPRPRPSSGLYTSCVRCADVGSVGLLLCYHRLCDALTKLRLCASLGKLCKKKRYPLIPSL